MGTPLIILGASARAAAQSAIRAGFTPYCIDLFADRDLQAVATVRQCPRGRYPEAMVEMIRDFPPGDILLTGAMENHLDVVMRLGNATQMVRITTPIQAARLPVVFRRVEPCAGVRNPAVAAAWFEPQEFHQSAQRGERFLLKPLRSGAGHGIRDWSPGERIDREHYVQQFIDGVVVGAVYAGGKLFGVTRQIVGDAAFGTSGFHCAGSIGPVPLTPRQRAAFEHLGRHVAKLCELTGFPGIFGIDAIIDAAGDVWPIEVNPRYTASVEILERALNVAVIWPNRWNSAELPGAVSQRQYGKAIVFARHDLIAPDLYDIFSKDQVADVPAIGEPIPRGQPICTVFADGDTHEDCLACLREMAQRLYTRLSP